MTNLEKFNEVFGYTGYGVEIRPSWAAKEYKGPVNTIELDKFIKWIESYPCNVMKYSVNDDRNTISIDDIDDNPIIRVSDFDSETNSAYAYYEGLAGYIPIDKIKEIVGKAATLVLQKHKYAKWDTSRNILTPIW